MKKKVIIGAAILVVIAGIVLGFTLFGRGKNQTTKYKKEAVKKGDIEALVVTTGTLNPVTVVDVGSQVSGKISKIYVDFNSLVKKGQVIAEIDQSSFLTRLQQNKANYESAKARLEKAKVTLENTKKKYERALNLFEKNLISYEDKETAETQYFSAKADLQSAEAGLEQAKSQLETSKVDLDYTIIKSPIDGVVISRNINVGQTVAASFQAPVLFRIANDLSKMQVECSVDEADIGKVKEGQKAKFTVDAFPNESFSGIVSQVRYSPEIIQNVVTYTTIVEVNNPELKLRPGMTATASIVVGEAKNKLIVPNAALRFTPSPEELQKIFAEIMEERRKQSGETGTQRTGKETGSLRAGSNMRNQFSSMRYQAPRRRNFSQVWIETDDGKLRPVIIKTGVTDNTYTEVVQVLRGTLEEGQEVIVGELTGSERGRSSRSNIRRGMMYIRR